MGAILLVTVPAIIITSACLGLALNIIPSLSMSYLLTATCIISMAQQAKPKVTGHKEPPFAQFIKNLNFIFIQFNNIFKQFKN
jgi:sulfopyruvate decarboxylase TPP-binding subunit